MSKHDTLSNFICKTLAMSFISLLGIFAFSSPSFASNQSPLTLNLAVASNFITPARQLAHDFEKETGHKVRVSYGSSGKFFAQIKRHAPYDVFLSADLEKPETLVEDQLAFADSLVIYARGQLVLWSRQADDSGTLEEALLKANRIAIANPKLAPYGKAAEETLVNLSIWEQTKKKLVQGESIGQTYQFVFSGNADTGLVAYSQILARPFNGKIVNIPDTLHDTIDQGGVILSNTENIELARDFMAFLMRSDTQSKIQQFGYANTPIKPADHTH